MGLLKEQSDLEIKCTQFIHYIFIYTDISYIYDLNHIINH